MFAQTSDTHKAPLQPNVHGRDHARLLFTTLAWGREGPWPGSRLRPSSIQSHVPSHPVTGGLLPWKLSPVTRELMACSLGSETSQEVLAIPLTDLVP